MYNDDYGLPLLIMGCLFIECVKFSDKIFVNIFTFNIISTPPQYFMTLLVFWLDKILCNSFGRINKINGFGMWDDRTINRYFRPIATEPDRGGWRVIRTQPSFVYPSMQ
jgi:hypothetical protein